VEAPSQMLQNWVWDKKVLDTFAADYRDPSKKIPAEIIKKMNDAKLADAGVFYRRQFAFASLDLALHDQHPEDAPYDCVVMSNPILEKVFLPIDPSTTFVSYFGHLNGYDAGYYGYAWADAIAADMATVFEKAKDGYLDKKAGMKLCHEIYEPGDSRGRHRFHREVSRPQTIDPAVLEKNRHSPREKGSGRRLIAKRPLILRSSPKRSEGRHNARIDNIAALKECRYRVDMKISGWLIAISL